MTDDELLPFKNKDGKYLMVNIEPIEEATSVTFNYRYYSLKNIETHNFNAHLSPPHPHPHYSHKYPTSFYSMFESGDQFNDNINLRDGVQYSPQRIDLGFE